MPVLAGGTGSSPIGDRPTLEWVGPDGTAFHLGNWSANKFFAADGVSGLGAAPRTIVADDSPQGGTTIRHIQHGPRRVPLPICWEGDDHAECLHWERRLGESLTSTRRLGAGQLRVMRPDGSVRQIAAVYEGGWDPEGTPTQRWAVPVLYCPDPLWSDPAETQLVSAYGDTGGDFLDPFPTISSSTALGRPTRVARRRGRSGSSPAPRVWSRSRTSPLANRSLLIRTRRASAGVTCWRGRR